MKKSSSRFSLAFIVTIALLFVVVISFAVFRASAPCGDGDNNCLYSKFLDLNNKRNDDTEHIASYFAPMYDLCSRMHASSKKNECFQFIALAETEENATKACNSIEDDLSYTKRSCLSKYYAMHPKE
jgi:hypothetical protein